jgi:HAD superfamily hydrolase (TIGR01490 family)
MNIIAFFDFDGTITSKDSFGHFLKFALGKAHYYFGLLMKSPLLAAYKLGLVPNYTAKEKLFMYFFRGWDISAFQELADKYSSEQVAGILRPGAMDKIRWHLREGHKVVVVTASLENWLKKWCSVNNLDLIATRIELIDGKITGRFATKNCYSAEKVRRITEQYDIKSYSKIYAYGDSKGDREMLDLADEKFYRYF